MARVDSCPFCNAYTLIAASGCCHSCQAEIAAKTRSVKGVLQTDCPLHPWKKIWCRAFANKDSNSAVISPVCRHHLCRVRQKKCAAALKKLLRQLAEFNRRSRQSKLVVGKKAV